MLEIGVQYHQPLGASPRFWTGR